ncbi:GumC domain-containing protein [Helicobacter pylori]|uniref:hypothetical protein n=1 Tax=Helicobacter pylori TaxID=210 RepID=UPI0009A2A146|nr:hypothetical protein [Helicobacter pylori]OPG48085.1 hypothetical protein BGL72_06325 [Helicobacter pylori]
MNYPNPPSPEITTKEKPAFKEITSELLRELESALNKTTSWEEQVNLSLKGVKRILEVIMSIDFFQKANEIDERLRGVIKWLENSSNGLQTRIREYERYLADFNASMRANEQEVTNILNANTQNIKSEVKKLENQLIETATRLLTSYQIFLKQARENANNEISTNKTESLEAIKGEKQQATSEINEAKKTAFNELLEILKPKFSGLFVGAYYIRNAIYIKSGWEQKVKDLSDYSLEKNKKYEIEVFFQFLSDSANTNMCFGLKTNEGFLKESIQKLTHKYTSQVYYKKLLVESVSGVLSLYHGYFNGKINFFNEESLITIIREIPNDSIISKISNGSNFSNVATITQNLNDTNNTQNTRN